MTNSLLPHHSGRYRQLTLGLISVLLLPPFLTPLFRGASLVAAAVFLVLVARSVFPGGGSRLFRLVLATAVLAVALRASSAAGVFQGHLVSLGLGVRVITASSFTFVVFVLLHRVLEAGPVDAEKLFAAVSAYLMIGLAFASCYEALAHWKPGAFTFAGNHASDIDGLFYFSLVTLSTVGYGDIVPNIPEARVLAVLEAITGQLYLAILMARLVGLHLNQSSSALELDVGPATSSLEEPPTAGPSAARTPP